MFDCLCMFLSAESYTIMGGTLVDAWEISVYIIECGMLLQGVLDTTG